MSGRENTRNNLREEISNAHKFGKVYMTLSKQSAQVHSSVRNRIVKWKQLPAFAGVDITSNLPQGQNI